MFTLRAGSRHQRTSLVDRLAGRLDNASAAMLATSVDQRYCDDGMPTDQVEGLLVRALAAPVGVAREYDNVPVIAPGCTSR